MPYVTQNLREVVDIDLDSLNLTIIDNIDRADVDGVLNYVISNIVATGIKPEPGPWRYADIARAIAVFECAKLEFYRRIAGPKEDDAAEQNGDIGPYETYADNEQ